MGVQLDSLHQAQQNTPYVRAVGDFNRLLVTYAEKPHLGLFNDLLWRALGYERETECALKALNEMTDRVS